MYRYASRSRWCDCTLRDSSMGPRVVGSHRHRGEEVNHGSVVISGGPTRNGGSRRIRCRAQGGRRLRPCPHAASKKQRESAPRLEGEEPLTSGGRPEGLVLLGHSRPRPGFLDIGADARCGVFFPPSARSIVRGWTLTENSREIRFANSRARIGSPATSCFSTKARISPWSLCGPRGPRFFGTRPATPASSKLALVW